MESKASIFMKDLTYVSYDIFEQYIKDNDLKLTTEGMHIFYVDKDNEVKAVIMHGFAFDMYYIKGFPNFETMSVVNNIIK